MNIKLKNSIKKWIGIKIFQFFIKTNFIILLFKSKNQLLNRFRVRNNPNLIEVIP